MATAQPGPCRCWTTMGWMSEDGGDRGRGAARHSAKVGVTWGWHRVHVACPGQGTEHRQGDTGGGREAALPPYFWCQGTSPVQALFRSPMARSS